MYQCWWNEKPFHMWIAASMRKLCVCSAKGRAHTASSTQSSIKCNGFRVNCHAWSNQSEAAKNNVGMRFAIFTFQIFKWQSSVDRISNICSQQACIAFVPTPMDDREKRLKVHTMEHISDIFSPSTTTTTKQQRNKAHWNSLAHWNKLIFGMHVRRYAS